jgi:hypothetical protein
VIQPPAFVVGAPCAGAEVLGRALARGTGVAHPVGWRLPPPRSNGGSSRRIDRLDRSDAPELGALAARSLPRSLRDSPGRAIDAAARPWRPVVAGGPVALQIPFLAEVFGDSRFVLVLRDADQAVADLAEAWRCGFWVNAERWTGSPWSMPFIPVWEEQGGAELEGRIAEQWLRVADTALDDLAELRPERWTVTELDRLIEHPAAELSRVCAFLAIEYEPAMSAPLKSLTQKLKWRPREG